MQKINLVIITGMSGAGKTVAIQSFEDMGYFTVDNMPANLIEKFVSLLTTSEKGDIDKVAMVVDMRSRSFFDALSDIVNDLSDNPDVDFRLLYLDSSDEELVARIGKDDMVRGNTISAVGFYGPQGRELRLPLALPELNSKIEQFEFNGRKITNYEMESAPLQGFAKLLGHKAMTVCTIIANRMNHNATPNYKTAINDLISTVLDRI